MQERNLLRVFLLYSGKQEVERDIGQKRMNSSFQLAVPGLEPLASCTLAKHSPS